MKRIYANWRLKCGENRRLKLTLVGETGPKAGIIEPAASPWASNVVLVHKKDNSLRFCVDYRQLNRISKEDSYPLPLVDNCLNALQGRLGLAR